MAHLHDSPLDVSELITLLPHDEAVRSPGEAVAYAQEIRTPYDSSWNADEPPGFASS